MIVALRVFSLIFIALIIVDVILACLHGTPDEPCAYTECKTCPFPCDKHEVYDSI